jgi:hypothetical protein
MIISRFYELSDSMSFLLFRDLPYLAWINGTNFISNKRAPVPRQPVYGIERGATGFSNAGPESVA